MVNEYLRQNTYQIGSLKNHIYLLPKSTTAINYSIDNNTCEVRGINADSIIKLIGVSTVFDETSNENTRFNYTSNITFKMREQWGEPWLILLEQIKSDDYYVIFEDTMGVQYIQTPEFTADFSYQYTFDNSSNDGNQVELYFKTDSNVPAIILNFTITPTQTAADNDCQYLGGRLENLRLCPSKNCYIEVEGVSRFTNIYTTGGETFKTVEPCKNNFQFRQQYKNNVYSDTITFTIPLSDYKYYFHYSLEEFTKNRYAVVFETVDGDNTIASGFEFGYFPEYTIQTSEEQNDLNTITITLRHVGSGSFLYSSERGAHYIEDETPRYARAGTVTDPTTGYEMTDYACITESQAIITLLQILTATGQPTGNYACLSGYESKYEHFNVTKVYQQTDDMGISLTYNSYDCATQEECRFIQSPPTSMSFSSSGQTRVVTIESTCEWNLTGLPSWLTASPVTGEANVATQVMFTCTADAVEGETQQGTLITTSGNLTKLTDVLLQPEVSWLKPIVFDISAKEQDCVSYYYIPMSRISLVSDGGIDYASISQNGTITMHVPSNTSYEDSRTFYVTFNRSDTNENVILTINQDHLYTEWITDPTKYICEDGDSYEWEELYVGYSEGAVTDDANQHRKGALIALDDERCTDITQEWRANGNTVCVGSDKYSEWTLYESSDGGTTWRNTGETKPGALIESNSPDCNSSYFWGDTGNIICRNGNSYKLLMKYYDDGTTITSTGETKIGDLVTLRDPACIADKDNYIEYTFVFDSFNQYVSQQMFYVRASTAFQVNWGDGTTDNYLLSDYSTGGYVYHTWADATQNLNYTYTIQIYGGISSLTIVKPANMGNYYTTAINLTNAPSLKSFTDRDASKIQTVDLTSNSQLVHFAIYNNVGDNGITSFTWPTVNNIEFLAIKNAETTLGHITSTQLNKIISDAPTVSAGLMEFCYQNDIYGVNQVCDVDQAAALEKGWMVSKECCETEGSVKYRRVDGEGYVCDSVNWVKWSFWDIQSSTYTSGSWSTWVSTGKTIKNQPIEYNSEDCGYTPTTQYEWRLTTRWECDDETYTSYYLNQQYESTDGGTTWEASDPAVYQRSDTVKETDDENCGYVPPGTYQERWFVVENEYICGNDAQNCNFQTLWVPLGFYYNENTGGGVFNVKTVSSIPDICNGTQLTTAVETFKNMSLITTAPTFDTRNIANMSQMFYGCTSLTTVPQYNYSSCQDISKMFYNTTALTSDIDFSTATNLLAADNVFYRSGVTKVTGIDANNLSMCGDLSQAWVLGGPNIETLEIDNLHNIILDVRNMPLSNESFEYLFMNAASTEHLTTFIWVSQDQWDLQIYPNDYFEIANQRYYVNFTVNDPRTT